MPKTTSYHIKDESALYQLTFTTIGWVDVFTRQSYCDIIIDSLRYCIKEKGLQLFGYVIMNNHMHLICRVKKGNKLSEIVRDFKKYTAKKIIHEIQTNPESRKDWMIVIFSKAGKSNPNNKEFQLWKQDNHPIELYFDSVFIQKLNYIHNNRYYLKQKYGTF